MRINDNALGGVDRYTDVAKAKTAAPTEEKAAASVKIGALSPDVVDAASQSATARAARIVQITSDVRSGAYGIDLQQLAESIAADEISRS